MITVAKPETQPQVSPRSPPSIPRSTDETPTTFRSKLPDIPIDTSLPLHSYCFQRVHPDRPCLIDTHRSRSFTYGETHLLSRRAASAFHSLGVRKGHVVMLLLQNCPEFAFAFMGASMLGAASTTANPLCTPDEIHKQFKASGAKLVITHRSFAHKVLSEPFPGDLTVLTVDEEKEGEPERCVGFEALLERADEAGVPEVEIEPEDPVAIPFSSGTTGLPKGVVLTHKSLITSVAQQVDGENPNLCMGEGDVVLCVLPMFHVFSLNSVLLCALRVGAGVAVIRKFDIEGMLGVIEREKVTVAAVVPPLVLAMAKSALVEKYDLGSIRKVLSGAAPLGKELEGALQRRLPQAIFGQGYGMTEAGPVLSMCPAFAKVPFPAKSGSCGTVVRNAELKVIDPETGDSLPRNKSGEICIRGQQIMKGYLNDPEATSRTIDVEGWLHTGDIGYVDGDDEIFIVDRVKELIKFKGFQVPPAELEALLVGHPSITDAAVVPKIDEVAGEVPAAFVVRANGCELTEEAVKEFIAKQVVFYKRLHKVYFVSAIPKSPAGKILRKDLRARLAATSS